MAIIGNAYIVVHAITSNFQQEVGKDLVRYNKDFAQAGRNAGQSFSKGLEKGSDGLSSFQRQAIAANEAFTKMVVTGYALGPALSVAIGGISSLVSGLFALGAQVASATPALFTLVGAFAAIAQGALAAKLAFGGIGAAFKQLTKSGGGAVKSAKQVENAERNLARVLEQNREALTRANERLADAEERLTEARKEAAEWLQQLNFDAEDAALAEKRAVLALEDARLSLMRVQDLPPNSRARTEAELAYAEADLNLRRAIDRNQDLASETDEANAKGVEGSKQVVDATKAVQEAIDDRARTERDALRSLIDAQNALNDARNSGGGGGGADALKDLSAEAARFVEYLVSIKDKTKGLKAAAGKYLFPQLETALDNIVNKLFPAFEPILEATGKALGKSAVDFANVVTEANNLEKFERVGKNNTYVIENLGKVVGNLYDSFLSLMDAAGPLIRRFTDWVVVLTDGWAESLNTKNATGELTDMFNRAGDAAAQIGRVLGNIWDGLMNLGKAASGPGSGGQQLMDTFEGATEKFSKFTESILKDGSAEQFFRDVADNFTEISRLISDIVGGFVSLGNEKGIGDTALKLRDAGPSIREMLETFIKAAPSFAEAAVGVADLVRAFTEDKSIRAFFGTLKVTLDILNAMFGNDVAKNILGFIAPVIGVYKAFWLLSKVGKFAGLVLLGYGGKAKQAGKASTGLIGILKGGAKGIGTFGKEFKNARQAGFKFFDSIKWGLVNLKIADKLKPVSKAFGTIGTGIRKIGPLFSRLGGSIKVFGMAIKAAFIANPITMWIAAIMAVIAIFVVLYNKVGWFRDFVNAVWGGIKAAFEAVFNFIKNNWQTLLMLLTGPFGIAVGLIIKYRDDIWNGIKTVWNWIKTSWGVIKSVLLAPFEALARLVVGVKDTIIGAFQSAFNFIAKAWNNTVGGFQFTAPEWLKYTGIGALIAGKTFKIPEIPEWAGTVAGTAVGGALVSRYAKGGIISKPTIAMMGEAGAEAVIPLTNPMRALEVMRQAGLMGLAKASAMTSAVGARNTQAQPFNINVYPSQGMDEVELASLVGRQVTLQLRKGTL